MKKLSYEISKFFNKFNHSVNHFARDQKIQNELKVALVVYLLEMRRIVGILGSSQLVKQKAQKMTNSCYFFHKLAGNK